MGGACTPAEFVKTTGLERIVGVKELPTPAAPEWTQRSPGPASRSSAGIPYPK